MAAHRIAVMPGDGIGKEVMPEGQRVLEAVAKNSASSSRSRISTGAATTTRATAG
jgi:isocitrate/isopropylmalate dehydrogenase